MLEVTKGLADGLGVPLHYARGIRFVIHLVFLQGTVAELAVLAGLATGEVDLVVPRDSAFVFQIVCKRFVVVVVLRDLLQMEPLVPALFLLFQLVQRRYVVLGAAAAYLACSVLAITDVSHHEILSHL